MICVIENRLGLEKQMFGIDVLTDVHGTDVVVDKIVCEIINCAKLTVINNLISTFQLSSRSTQQISLSLSNSTAVSLYCQLCKYDKCS